MLIKSLELSSWLSARERVCTQPTALENPEEHRLSRSNYIPSRFRNSNSHSRKCNKKMSALATLGGALLLSKAARIPLARMADHLIRSAKSSRPASARTNSAASVCDSNLGKSLGSAEFTGAKFVSPPLLPRALQ
jgi:hypothetical protein